MPAHPVAPPPPAGYQLPTQPAGYGPPPGYAPGTPPAGYGPRPGWPTLPVSPAGQPLANFGDRFLAVLIDGAIGAGVAMAIMIPTVILVFVAVIPSNPESMTQADANAAAGRAFLWMMLAYGVVFLLLLALSYWYYVERLWPTGQTVGKKVMKIRIVPLEPATTLTRGMAAKRFLIGQIAAGFVPGLHYLDGLWQLWDKPYQQCLHDKYARTVVVKVSG